MTHRITTILAMCGLSALAFTASCADEIKDLPITLSEREAGAAGNGGSGGGVNVPRSCTTECCPEAPECYVNGKDGPGAECLATRDNTGKTKIQLRQTWVYPTSPAGLLSTQVYTVLNRSTNMPHCQAKQGVSGYIRVMEQDLESGISRVGWAKFVPPSDVADTLENGYCIVESPPGTGWSDPTHAMADSEIYKDPEYPPGLPQPAGQPWAIKPTKAKRLETDFDLSRDGEGDPKAAENRGALTETGKATRLDLLAKTLEKENVDAGISGFFYTDEQTGTTHGFATIAYQVIYNYGRNGASYIVVPIHEPETFHKYTDPQQRNCVGVFRAGQIPDVVCEESVPTNEEMMSWSGVDMTKLGVGDAWTKGYFLIAELEQIRAELLSSTLCASYPGPDYADLQKWVDTTKPEKSCRDTGTYNSRDPVNGVPKGDWCSRTNGPATDTCHDAWLTVAYHGFAAANIREETCTP